VILSQDQFSPGDPDPMTTVPPHLCQNLVDLLNDVPAVLDDCHDFLKTAIDFPKDAP